MPWSCFDIPGSEPRLRFGVPAVRSAALNDGSPSTIGIIQTFRGFRPTQVPLTEPAFCEIDLSNIVQPKSACLPAGLTRGNQIPRLSEGTGALRRAGSE